jgi:hypothetical protein
MKDIFQEAVDFGFLFDKSIQVYNSLPYGKDSVLMAPNEFVRSNIINKKLEYLHYNYLFLYKLCLFTDFIVPSTALFSYSGNNTRAYESVYNKFINSSNTIAGSVAGAISYDAPSLGGTVIFYITNSEIVTSIVDRDNIDILSKTSFIDPISGTIKFENANIVKTNKNKKLYVVDNAYKNIFYYNITNILENDNIYRNLPFLQNVAGGAGPLQENLKFNNINNIAVNDKFVIVEDNINKCLKLLDFKLNWLSTTTLRDLFTNIGKFNCMAVDSFDKLYCITNQKLYIFQIEEANDYNIRLLNITDISLYVNKDETPLNICFSNQSDFIFYVITDKGIKKVWSTTPEVYIGKYAVENKIVWGDVFAADQNEDNIILKTHTIDKDGDGFILMGFRDSLSVKSIITNKNFEIYSHKDFLIKRDEYTSNWVFQKAIKKIYYNLNRLLKEIKFKLVEDDNKEVPEIVNQIYNQAFLSYAYDSIEIPNLSIGLNENFQAEVINRVLQEILNFQTIFLLNITNNKRLKKYYSPAPEKSIKNAIFYDYFSDGSLNISSRPVKLQPFEDIIALDGITLTVGGAPYKGGEGISVTDGQFN